MRHIAASAQILCALPAAAPPVRCIQMLPRCSAWWHCMHKYVTQYPGHNCPRTCQLIYARLQIAPTRPKSDCESIAFRRTVVPDRHLCAPFKQGVALTQSARACACQSQLLVDLIGEVFMTRTEFEFVMEKGSAIRVRIRGRYSRCHNINVTNNMTN